MLQCFYGGKRKKRMCAWCQNIAPDDRTRIISTLHCFRPLTTQKAKTLNLFSQFFRRRYGRATVCSLSSADPDTLSIQGRMSGPSPECLARLLTCHRHYHWVSGKHQRGGLSHGSKELFSCVRSTLPPLFYTIRRRVPCCLESPPLPW